MTRIYEINELAQHVGKNITVDCDEGLFRNALLDAVRTDGTFEIITENGVEFLLSLNGIKVFA